MLSLPENGTRRLSPGVTLGSDPMAGLLVSDGGARGSRERYDLYLFEANPFAPGGKVTAREIECVPELDQHVQGHQ